MFKIPAKETLSKRVLVFDASTTDFDLSQIRSFLKATNAFFAEYVKMWSVDSTYTIGAILFATKEQAQEVLDQQKAGQFQVLGSTPVWFHACLFQDEEMAMILDKSNDTINKEMERVRKAHISRRYDREWFPHQSHKLLNRKMALGSLARLYDSNTRVFLRNPSSQALSLEFEDEIVPSYQKLEDVLFCCPQNGSYVLQFRTTEAAMDALSRQSTPHRWMYMICPVSRIEFLTLFVRLQRDGKEEFYFDFQKGETREQWLERRRQMMETPRPQRSGRSHRSEHPPHHSSSDYPQLSDRSRSRRSNRFHRSRSRSHIRPLSTLAKLVTKTLSESEQMFWIGEFWHEQEPKEFQKRLLEFEAQMMGLEEFKTHDEHKSELGAWMLQHHPPQPLSSCLDESIPTVFGQRYEKVALDWLQEMKMIDAKEENKHVHGELLQWEIVGQVDAKNQDTIFEIKTRTRNKVFGYFFPYELTQAYLYMYCSKLKRACLIEQARDEHGWTRHQKELVWNHAIFEQRVLSPLQSWMKEAKRKFAHAETFQKILRRLFVDPVAQKQWQQKWIKKNDDCAPLL